jgi:hypothetical protein
MPEATDRYNELQLAAQAAYDARQGRGNTKKSKAEGLFGQVHDCIQKLLANPRHPGLKTHAYDSLQHPLDKKIKVFEAYAQNNTPGAYRVFWCYGPTKTQITIIAITPHP